LAGIISVLEQFDWFGFGDGNEPDAILWSVVFKDSLCDARLDVGDVGCDIEGGGRVFFGGATGGGHAALRIEICSGFRGDECGK